jgi:DNA helicase TIP49 (TBP-interacting protein)
MLFAVVYNFRKLNLQIVEEAFGFQKNNSSFTSLRYCMYLLKQEMASTSDIFFTEKSI